jgi:hypothetical protein
VHQCVLSEAVERRASTKGRRCKFLTKKADRKGVATRLSRYQGGNKKNLNVTGRAQESVARF